MSKAGRKLAVWTNLKVTPAGNLSPGFIEDISVFIEVSVTKDCPGTYIRYEERGWGSSAYHKEPCLFNNPAPGKAVMQQSLPVRDHTLHPPLILINW